MTTLAAQDPVSLPRSVPPPDALYEIIDDEYRELPPMSTYAVVLANLLAFHLNSFALPRRLGIAVCEPLIGLRPASRRKYRPDVVYVSHARWARDRPWPHTDPWPVIPEIAVEVVSPNDIAEDLMTKVKEYLAGGVLLVWVVYPQLGWLHVFESSARMRGLTAADELDAGSVLPGFRLPLRELFTQSTEPATGNGESKPAE